MKNYRAEFHVHTVLSPCGDIEMIPPLIVQEAAARGINWIAITDHNAAANVEAVQQAARGTELVVLPGMELQTIEEVHVLCLFDTLEQVLDLQDWVYQSLPAIENQPEFFGEQFVVDYSGDFIRREERLLLTSAQVSFKEAWEKVTGIGGLFIPAHVNRKAFGLLPTLGFVPVDVAVEAVEISRHITPEAALQTYPQLRAYPMIQSGDVHLLDDFLGINEIFVEAPTIAELRLALHGKGGRKIIIQTLPVA